MGNTTVDNMVLQFITRGENAFKSTISSVGRSIGTLENRMTALGTAGNVVAAVGGYKVLSFIKQLGNESLNAVGMMDQSEKAMGALLHNQALGIKTVNEALQYSRNTPFSFQNVTHEEQTLEAMGFAAKDLMPTMKALGNVVSSVGGGDAQFARISYRLGEIRAQGKAYARDLMDLGRNGINYREIMEAGLGHAVTKDQLTEMDGEKFVEAFIKGVQIKFGGVMDKMMDTIPGQLHKLENSKMILKIDMGKAFSGSYMKGLQMESALVDKLDYFVKHHPRITAGLEATAGVGALGLTGVAGATGLAMAYNQITTAVGKASAAKRVLTDVTKLDTAAEGAKAIVAGREGNAIGDVGTVVEDAIKSKKGLSLATKEAGGYSAMLAAETEKIASRFGLSSAAGMKNAEQLAKQSLAARGITAEMETLAPAAETAAIKLSKLDRIKNLLGRSISPAMSEIPQLQKQMFDPMGFYTKSNGVLATRRQIFPTQAINRRIMAAASEGEFTSNGFNMLGGEAITYGGAGVAGALGIGAGVSAYNNWEKAGDTTGAAAAKATVTGVGAGLVSLFVPGGAVMVAATEGLAFAINKAYNEPMENKAVSDNPLGDTPATQGMTSAQKAAFYANKAKHEHDGFLDWASPGVNATNEDRRKEDLRQSQLFAQQDRHDKAHAKLKKDAADKAAAEAKAAKDQRANDIYNTINGGAAFYGGSQGRNGAWTITIPQSAADKSHNKLKANNNMTPNFL